MIGRPVDDHLLSNYQDRYHYFTDQFVPSSLDHQMDPSYQSRDGSRLSAEAKLLNEKPAKLGVSDRIDLAWTKSNKLGIHKYDTDGTYVGKLLPEKLSNLTDVKIKKR